MMTLLHKFFPGIFPPPDYIDPIFGPEIPDPWWKSYGIHLFLQFLLFAVIAFAGVLFLYMMCNIRRYFPRSSSDKLELYKEEPPIDYTPPASRRTFSQPVLPTQPRAGSSHSMAKTY